MRGASLALPTFATAQFKSFFDCGRAVRCMLPLASGRIMHLFVLYGYQGADADAEQLALTEQLFDAALSELHVVACGQPCLLVGDFNVEAHQNPLKGILAGCSLLLLVCVVGLRLVVIVGTLLLVVLLLPLLFFPARFSWIGGLLLTLRSVLFLTVVGGSPGLRSLFSVPPFGLLLGCLLSTRLESLCLVRMPLCLMNLLVGIMFLWLGLFGLGLLSLRLLMRLGSVVVLFLLRGWFLRRGGALLRMVQLAGPWVRRARANAADALDAADIFLCRDSSLAPLLDMRRRFKA